MTAVTRPRGRPTLPTGTGRGIRVPVYLTPAELAEIDRRREQDAAATATEPDTRSDWLLRAAGVRPVAAPTQYRSDTLYMSEAVRADLRAAMQTEPVVRLDSTTGAWTVADGWTAAETEPGMFTVQRDGEPVAVVRGPGVRLDIGMTAPRRPALAGTEPKERKP